MCIGGGFAGKTGLYQVGLPVKVKTKSGYQTTFPGNSIDLAYPNHNSRRGRVGSDVAHTVTPSNTQAVFFVALNPDGVITENARCLTTRQNAGITDSQLYKMAGNAVSVPVISALGEKIKRIYEGVTECQTK